jgi:hypothetical protein
VVAAAIQGNVDGVDYISHLIVLSYLPICTSAYAFFAQSTLAAFGSV